MLVVVVDTSTPAVSAALVRIGAVSAAAGPAAMRGSGVDLLAQHITIDARAHGELLAPAIHSVLADTGHAATDLTAVVAGLGPGPFTGLRVGLVTAAALGQALNIPTYGVCSLDGIGATTATATATGTALVATDARRSEVYWALYRDGVRLTDPAVDRPADLARRIADPATAAAFAPAFAVGDGALRYRDALGQSELALPVLEEYRYPSMATMAGLAARQVRAGAPSQTLTPLYLRRPDAVESAQRPAAIRSALQVGRG